jgi:hypothetical protein
MIRRRAPSDKEVVHENGILSATSMAPMAPICAGPATAKTIWGFQKATLWLLAALVIAIVAAAVAAGVGGSIAASKSRQAQDVVENGRTLIA